MSVLPALPALPAAATALLAGPRGRRLCLEYAVARNAELGRAVFFVSREAAPEHTVVLSFGGDGDEPTTPAPTIADVIALIAATGLRPVNDASVQAALRASVDAAMY